MKCEICNKTPQFGHNVSHSKRATNRRFMPNIHKVTLVKDGKKQRMTLCTRCLRTQNKPAKTA
ncbi:MAG: 50S ribosomal protein L28 [Chloroflexi bacterium]|nr:50S ribosomal protein L28 [Chloroflexota bacterium]